MVAPGGRFGRRQAGIDHPQAGQLPQGLVYEVGIQEAMAIHRPRAELVQCHTLTRGDAVQ